MVYTQRISIRQYGVPGFSLPFRSIPLQSTVVHPISNYTLTAKHIFGTGVIRRHNRIGDYGSKLLFVRYDC